MWYLLLTILVPCLGGLLFGYFTAVISGALLFLSDEFHLSITQQAFVVSFLLLGCIAGAAIAGPATERMGRKPSMALSAFIFILSGLMLALAPSYEGLLLGRTLGGIAVGIASVVSPLYIAEVSPPQQRGTFVTSYQLAITLGILLSFVVNYSLAESANWRLMFAFGMLPALLQLVGLLGIKESPAWLQRRRSHHLYAREPRSEGMLLAPKIRTVFFIGVLLSVFQQITGINTVIYYAPRIFELANFSTATSALLATVGVGIINVFATILSVFLTDRAGRRALLLVGLAGMTSSLFLLAGSFYYSPINTKYLAVTSLMAYVTFFAIGLGPITWVLLSELYPLKVRSKAMTVALMANWVSNYLVSLVFLGLIELFDAHGTFFLFGLISALTWFFVYRLIPETKGKSLEEIEAMVYRE